MQSSLHPSSAAMRIVAALVAQGTDTFFGIPGGPVCPIFEAIRLTPGAKLIESRHETHAAFAASLYYRASNKVPAVVVTAGPGITNVVTGATSGWLERTPMVIITGDVSWQATGKRLAQDSGPEGIHAEALLSPVTCVQIRCSHPRSAATQVIGALFEARRTLKPALFIIPLDHSMSEGAAATLVAPPVTHISHVEGGALSAVGDWLRSAKRPLIVIGAGCRGRELQVTELIRACNVPFVTTPRAKGFIDEFHPRSLRNCGIAASMWARRYTAEPIDVCIALGTDLDDSSVGPTPCLGPGGRLVHVDVSAGVFGRNYPTALGIVADVGDFCRELVYELKQSPKSEPSEGLTLAKNGSPFDVPEPGSDDSTPIQPHRALTELQRYSCPRTQFITDIGEHMLFALHYLTAKPGSFFIQLNLGSMASGIAGSIGLAVADPTRPVVCIAGDGGMQMAGMEALVALKMKLPILFVVFNDGRYNMVHHGMKQIFGESEEYATPPIDFVSWATSFGLRATRIDAAHDITADVVNSLVKDGPALLDVRINKATRIKGGGRVEALQHMSMQEERK